MNTLRSELDAFYLEHCRCGELDAGVENRSREAEEEMRHALIYRKAELLDDFIDVYKRARKLRHFPHQAVGTVIRLLFPGGRALGRGAFKTVHKIFARERDLVLKTSHRKNLHSDERAYR